MVNDDALADKFESAYGREVKVLGLDIPERETIIRALEDPPAGLEELRGVLLREHELAGARGAVVSRVGRYRYDVLALRRTCPTLTTR